MSGRGGVLLYHAAGTDVPAGVVGVETAIDLDALAGAGMDELEAAGLRIHLCHDTDMTDAADSAAGTAEEDKVALLEFGDIVDVRSLVILRLRGVGELDVVLAEHVTGETAAVETAGAAGTAAVAHAEILEGGGEQLVHVVGGRGADRLGLLKAGKQGVATHHQVDFAHLELHDFHLGLLGECVARHKGLVGEDVILILGLQAAVVGGESPHGQDQDCNDKTFFELHEFLLFCNPFREILRKIALQIYEILAK